MQHLLQLQCMKREIILLKSITINTEPFKPLFAQRRLLLIFNILKEKQLMPEPQVVSSIKVKLEIHLKGDCTRAFRDENNSHNKLFCYLRNEPTEHLQIHPEYDM